MFPLFDDEYDDFDVMEFLLECYKALDAFPTERPFHSDKQVLAAEDLIIGELYTEHLKGGYTRTFKVLGLPELGSLGDWWIEVEYMYKNTKNYVNKSSMSDSGIIAYPNGKWNSDNYVTVGVDHD